MTATLQNTESRSVLTRDLKSEASRLGFDLVGVAPAVTPGGFPQFQKWLGSGYAGEMTYLPNREQAYAHPESVLECVRSVVMLAVNYNTASRERQRPERADSVRARVARYAWGREDYHDVLKRKLRLLADFLHARQPECRTRVVVDTAPLLERDFARLSGLGWFGKNTMLIDKRMGSWLFLAALLTDADLDCDAPHETAHCGTCTRCLDACPTDAFPEPYVLDARKCISYLNIELRSAVPMELRDSMGDWLFGCDICQDVCPWNRKSPVTDEPAFQPPEGRSSLDAIELIQLGNEEFRSRFRKTPLWRPKRAGILRNAAIVLGNSRKPQAVEALIGALNGEDPLLRGAAAWALGKIGGENATTALQARRDKEDNREVIEELSAAIEMSAHSTGRVAGAGATIGSEAPEQGGSTPQLDGAFSAPLRPAPATPRGHRAERRDTGTETRKDVRQT